MSKTIKERFIGVATTLFIFLIYSFVGQFETKAASEAKYMKIKTEITIIKCHLMPKSCLKKDK